MAKQEVFKPKYPSQYGSHKKMLADAQEPVEGDSIPDGMVICTDEHGDYTTFEDRLDSGLADPLRWDRLASRKADPSKKDNKDKAKVKKKAKD